MSDKIGDVMSNKIGDVMSNKRDTRKMADKFDADELARKVIGLQLKTFPNTTPWGIYPIDENYVLYVCV